MLYEEERKHKIVEYVQEHSRGSVQELSSVFEVSDSTIRRDLKELEDAKLLKRTHGGAVCLEGVNFEPTFVEKEDKLCREKESIAKRSAEFIQDGDTILLDSGTTTFYMINELKRFNGLTVVTNSLILAQKLHEMGGVEVVLTGGTLRSNTLALVGPIAEQSLDLLHVDKGFIATNACDMKEGLMTPNVIEAATKRKMIEISSQVFLLADHTKFERVSFVKFANLSDIDICITDEGTSRSVIEAMENKEIEVCVVK